MPTGQCKNTIIKSLGNMAPPDPSYLAKESLGYSNIAEAQEKDLKTNYMKMTLVLKVAMNKIPYRNPGKHDQTIGEKSTNPLGTGRRRQTNNWRKPTAPLISQEKRVEVKQFKTLRIPS